MNTENNKLIAEFIGIYLKDNNYQIDNDNLKWMVISANTWINEPNEQHFDFCSSWDWLMGVVEKIESLKFSVLIGKNTCVIEQTFGKISLNLGVSKSTTKIEATYNACVEFIKWNNKQNQ